MYVKLVAKVNSVDTSGFVLKTKYDTDNSVDSSHFREKSHFEDDGTQKYLVFQQMYRYF